MKRIRAGLQVSAASEMLDVNTLLAQPLPFDLLLRAQMGSIGFNLSCGCYGKRFLAASVC